MAKAIQHTADIVAFRRGRDEVALIARRDQPFKGMRALPGGYVDPDEDIIAAAIREAREETSLDLRVADLTFVGVYGKPGRDPRGRVVSTAYAVVVPPNTTLRAGDDAAAASWVAISDALKQPMAFDHHTILTDAVRLVRGNKLM